MCENERERMDSIFLVRGHGIEELVDLSERPVIPKGYTLVTFSECGQVTYYKNLIGFTQLFQNPENKDILANPEIIKLSNLVDYDTIHIYREGDKYPKLSTSFVMDWPNSTNTSQYSMAKSGLYKFPLSSEHDFSIRTIDIVKQGFNPAIKDAEEFKSFYKDALYPTSEVLDRVTSSEIYGKLPKFYQLNLRLGKTVDYIFELCGPGVYYWPVCRGLNENVSSLRNYANNILDYYSYEIINNANASYLMHRRANYFPYYYTWLKNYNKVSEMMDANQLNEKIPNRLKNTLKTRRNKTNETYKQVIKIRRNSLNAQHKKTRKKKNNTY